MSKTNTYIFTGLKIIVWIIFISLCIEAGALLFNFIYSLFNPIAMHNLYKKLDLSEMYARSKWTYYSMCSFILLISILKAMLFYEVIKLVTKINLLKPFSNFVSNQITRISYYTFSVGILSHIARQVAKSLQHHGYIVESLNQFWEDSQAFIFMAAVIYVIAIIFSKGLELQNENELTV